MSENTEMIKHGIVSSIDAAKCTARVTFPDRDEVVSAELPILQHNVGFARIYTMPEVGQAVLCAFMGTGMEDGFILGSFYNAENPPPATDAGIHVIDFKDGGRIEYSGGKFKISNADLEILNGDVIADGISLKSHRTTGVQPGSGLSGGPQ